MEFSNKKRSKRIKQTFNLFIVLLLLIALFFVWKEMDIAALITGGVLILSIVLVQFVNLHYIFYSSENDEIIVRYYPIITFFGKEYSSVEFKKTAFQKAEVRRAFLFSDLILSIKTSKGIADYPEISLSALSRKQIAGLKADLEKLKS